MGEVFYLTKPTAFLAICEISSEKSIVFSRNIENGGNKNQENLL